MVFINVVLRVRTLEEQAKPSAAVSDPASVTAAPTYVDSPRKVRMLCAPGRTRPFASALSFCRHVCVDGALVWSSCFLSFHVLPAVICLVPVALGV